MTGLTLILFSALVVAAAKFSLGNPTSPAGKFLSPLAERLPVLGTRTTRTDRPIVFGFLPFWNLKYESYFHYDLLTHIAFFGLDFDAAGKIRTRLSDGTIEPGWTAYQSEAFGRVVRRAHQSGAKAIVVLRAMDQTTIESIIQSPAKQQNVIDQTKTVIDLKNLDGVNIDFEYAGTPTQSVRNKFTQFVAKFSQDLKSHYPHLEISLDVFADTATKYRIWDLPALAPSIDHLIIMAYDFYRPSSSVAGPIAPLRGGCNGKIPTSTLSCAWDLDITQTLADFTQSLTSSKLLLGVPYYGYGWQTTSDKVLSATFDGSGELATFTRVQDLINQPDPAIKNLSLNWSPLSLSPYLTYQTNGRWHQIWFEDERSLKLKYDLANQAHLGGIAIWALGYDTNHPELWNLLKSFTR